MLADIPHLKLDKERYREQLADAQLELMKLQHGLYQQKKRCVIVVEGTDASGKGGMIRRATEMMDPRGFRVHPIGAPTPTELAEHYLQRFWRRLPKAGQLTIFDRSWYGRVLVERVDNLVSEETWSRAYREINEFEKLLVDDGVILIKLFFTIDKDEQLLRFKERYEQAHKRWKLTPEDFTARAMWDDYQAAFEDMLTKTHKEDAPWKIIGANQKRAARIEALKELRKTLARHIDLEKVNLLSPEVRKLAQLAFEHH